MDPYQIEDDPYNIEIDASSFYDASQRAMLILHPWIFFASMVIFTIGGLYAGIVYPILSKLFRLKFFNNSYAHKSRWFTIILSAIIGIGTPVCFTLLWWFDGRNRNLNIVESTWFYLDYWRFDERFVMPGYLFWYIYGSFFFNLILNTIFYLVSRWKPIPTEIKQSSERHAFIIVAHNSSWKLEAPIECILKFAKPHQIYIADNGSSVEEMEKTRLLCESYSIGDSKIQLSHLKYANKTLAQYACVCELNNRLANGESFADIVTLIDDDVFIPETFPSDSLEQQFTDPSKIAIAYPLRIANADASTYATIQDAEYFTGNVARYIQDLLGSQLFASGAIATWKVQPLKNVLERHCTAFNGEDLEMGYLLHKLCDNKQTEKLGVDCSVRIGFEANCCVPTTVPVHLYHWYDMLPAPLRRKLKITACPCKEASFFNQRLRSWDPACHAYLFKFLRIIFSPRGTLYAPKMFIRVLCLWKVISIIREYLLVFGIVFSLARIRNTEQAVNLAIFYLDSILISWALGVLTCLSQSMSVSRQGFAIRPDIIFTYPLLLELPYSLVIRPMSACYSYAYYLLFQMSPPPLKDQLEKDAEKATALENVWKA